MCEILRFLVVCFVMIIDDVSDMAGDGQQHLTEYLPALESLSLVQTAPGFNLAVERRES